MNRQINTFREALTAEAAALGAPLSRERLGLFSAHYELLLEWNARVRLVGAADPRRAAVELYADSLALAGFLEKLAITGPARTIDIGAGAGLPGIIVKVMHPEWPLTLLEPSIKKIAFLKIAVARLGLGGVEAVRGRAEVLARDPALRERHDLAFCRAVAPPAEAMELAVPFVRVGGYYIAQTSEKDTEQARAAATRLGIKSELSIIYKLSSVSARRVLMALRKLRPTPSPCPRGPKRRKPLV